MKRISRIPRESKPRINRVEQTTDRITGRGGLSLFVRYLDQSRILENLLIPRFAGVRKNRKGASVYRMLKQVFCFFMDGTSRHLTYFDLLKEDEGYAGAIEVDPGKMVSSHAVKRFIGAFSWPLIWSCRRILLDLFVWRVQLEKPPFFIIDIDAMPMDNDEARKREGVNPTYKKFKGFCPLQMTWNGRLIDTILRSGEKHSNHGRQVERMIRRVVEVIRKRYREDVPILFHLDSGFMDQKIFEVFESLEVGYTCTGKLYKDIVERVKGMPDSAWDSYFGPGKMEEAKVWEYVEFGDRRGSWKRFRRTIFTRPLSEDNQLIMTFARPCTVLYTNLGMGFRIDEQLRSAGLEELLFPEGIIEFSHDRGRSELTFRGLKDFADQRLPFDKFRMNAAYYALMAIGFFLFESFKEDVCDDVVSVNAYATTLRRKVIDIAAKVVSNGHQIFLKVSKTVWEGLEFAELWRRSNNPPRFCPR
jgi:hypothetical protein